MQATFTIPDLRIIRDLVCDGHGWTVLPDYHCDNDLKSGRLISVTPADLAPTNHLYLVWNKGRLITAEPPMFGITFLKRFRVDV